MPRRRKARSLLPAHVHAVKTRGREYFYYQPNRGTPVEGPRVRVRGLPFDAYGGPNANWWAAYRRFTGTERQAPAAGTFSALIASYKSSPEWHELGERTRAEWSRDLARIDKAWGKLAVVGLKPKHVLQLRDRHADTPAAANNLIKCPSAMITWSIPRGWRTHNLCAHIKKLKIGAGYAPWDWADIEHFRKHACGDLWQAAALALYTGQCLSDVLKMRWDDIENGLIAVVQNKTGKRLWNLCISGCVNYWLRCRVEQ